MKCRFNCFECVLIESEKFIDEELTEICKICYFNVIKKNELKYVPFQNCPKCNAQGKVWFPPNLPWNPTFVGNGEPYDCDLCNGAMVIPMAVIPDKYE